MEHHKRDDDRQNAVIEGFGPPGVRTRNFLVPAPCHEHLLSELFRCNGRHPRAGQVARATSSAGLR